jgi:FkbM family methyltransferase
MTHKDYMTWIGRKNSYAFQRYGLNGLWGLLDDNYPEQQNDIYLYGGVGGAFAEYKWILERFLEAAPKLGITFNGCIMSGEAFDNKEFMGIRCVSESDFVNRVTANTRLIIGFPGWCLQTEEIINKFSFMKDLLIPIADIAQPQYCESDILQPLENEIFVDVGVFNLGNSVDFSKWATRAYEKIYAFEPDPTCFGNSLKRLKESGELDTEKVELLNKGLSSNNGVLSFPAIYNGSGNYTNNDTIEVEVVSLDSFLHGRKVTFIKMDVEGAEMDVLLGMQETIRVHKPKLAVCIYHKHEDVFEISSFILSLVPEYKFYIRHYSSNETEEVLLCIV